VAWKRLGGGDQGDNTSVLVDGFGWDFNGLVSVQGTDLVVRRRDDEDSEVQRIPIEHLLWLLKAHEVAR
jgi:hypothetical protein